MELMTTTCRRKRRRSDRFQHRLLRHSQKLTLIGVLLRSRHLWPLAINSIGGRGPASSSTHKSLFSQRGIFHSTHVSLLMDSSKDALISGSQVRHPRGDALRSSSSGFLSNSPPLASNIRAAAPGWSSTDRGCLVKDASGSKSTMAAAAAKRVSFQLDEATRDGPIRGQASKAAARQGSRFCGFLASACRECQAFDPTKHVLSSSRNNSNRHNSSRMARTF